MISLVKVIIEHFSKLLGKRGELRNKDILLTPQLSSSFRMLKFLSSCVLLLKKLVNYSYILLRVSIDPRVKPEGDRKESVPEGDRKENVPEGDRKESVFEGGGRWKNAPEGDNLYKVMPRFGTNRSGIFELGKNKIGRSFDVFWRKRGMTLLVIVLFLFPNLSYSATVFLPDAQWDAPMNVSIDSSQCEISGYTYYSSGTCPAYHNQETCVFNDKYLKCDATGWCRDNSYTISSCTSPKIVDTQCPNGLSLYKYCACPSTYKYTCTGTGYSSGNGTVCDGKYTKCNCSSLYDWTGSACIHTHSYSCPDGYSTSSSGMISPASTAKTCACGATSGSCYKETHSHSYSCTSGYSSSCSYGYWGTASKKCSCGATSGTCYDCKSYCEANPCGSGCYTDRSCTYGCASYNSCGGCQSCESAPVDPCAGVSCPSAKSCTYGCASYSTATSCCSSVCTSCESAPSDPCASVTCPTAKSCSNGCASYSTATSCCSSVCTSCKSAPSDPCAGVTCPTAKSCDYGCASYSTATSCCSSVCTSCKTNPCASVTCPTAKSCDYGCASYSTATSCCSSVCTSCKACTPKTTSSCPTRWDWIPVCNRQLLVLDDGCGGTVTCYVAGDNPDCESSAPSSGGSSGCAPGELC